MEKPLSAQEIAEKENAMTHEICGMKHLKPKVEEKLKAEKKEKKEEKK